MLPRTEKLLNDSNKTPDAEASSFISRSIDSDAMLSLDKFENENAAKDATIATLKELNSELLDEIKFLENFSGKTLEYPPILMN